MHKKGLSHVLYIYSDDKKYDLEEGRIEGSEI